MRRAAIGFALVALASSSCGAEVRQIEPDKFAPMYRDSQGARPHPLASTPAPAATAPPRPAPAVQPPRPNPVTPSRARPLGACERGSRDWLNCLASTATLADAGVDTEERALLASLPSRPGLNPLMSDAVGKALKAAEEAWRVLRERECGDLALIERAYDGTLYEDRLVCRIRRDVERVESLRERYGGSP